MFFERCKDGHRIVVQMLSNEDPYRCAPCVCYNSYAYKGCDQLTDYDLSYEALVLYDE